MRRPYIQLNPPHQMHFLLFDVDTPDAGAAWLDADLPAPTFITQNQENGHAHIVYGLERGSEVCKSDAARTAPMRYAAAIERAYGHALGADQGYARLATKNPLHPSWRLITPSAISPRLYTLDELSEYVDLGIQCDSDNTQADSDYGGIGRNCLLFERLRHWAYHAVPSYWGNRRSSDWDTAVLCQAERFNCYHSGVEPLPVSEVKSTARSVSRWVWREITPAGRRNLIERTHTSQLQAQRGRQKGALKRQQGIAAAASMAGQGYSHREIAGILGVDHRTVGRWIQRHIHANTTH